MVLLGVCAFFLPYMPGSHPFLALEYSPASEALLVFEAGSR